MKIALVTVYPLDPSIAGGGQALSGGRLFLGRPDSTLVSIETGDGIHGWGQSCPWGAAYPPAHGRGARAAVAEVAPGLIGA